MPAVDFLEALACEFADGIADRFRAEVNFCLHVAVADHRSFARLNSLRNRVVNEEQDDIVMRGDTAEVPLGYLIDAVEVAEDKYEVIMMRNARDAVENGIEFSGRRFCPAVRV